MITENLQKLNADLLSSYAAVDAKNGTIPTDKNSNNLAASIATIPTGGGGGVGEHWTPNPEWFDVEAIITADTEPTTGGKVIYLLNGDTPTTPLSIAPTVFYKIKTSDGNLYDESGVVSHVWDLTKDQVSTDGKRRTRYFIGYTSEGAKDFGAYAQSTPEIREALLYCVMKEVTTCAPGATVGQRFGANSAAAACRLLESVKFLSVGKVPNSGASIGLYQNCASLQKLELPDYTGAPSSLYLSFSNVSSTAFIKLPETSKIASINIGFHTLISEVRGLKIARNFAFTTPLSAHPCLSVDTWTDIAHGIEDNTAYPSVELEIGATNIERLNNYKATTGVDLINLITDKNYTVL